MKLIFDLQILQTPARFRGMGQYVSSLLQGYSETINKSEPNEVYFLLTDQITIDNDLRKKLKQIFFFKEKGLYLFLCFKVFDVFFVEFH